MALILKNSIFIHIPKTGGSWCRTAIQKSGIDSRETGIYAIEDHYGYQEIIENHPELINFNFFGFVRHPIRWLISRWAFALKTNFAERKEYNPEAAKHWMSKCWSDNFEIFIDKYIEQQKSIVTDYFKSKLNNFEVIDIGQQEQLEKDFIRFMKQFNENIDINMIRKIKKVNIGKNNIFISRQRERKIEYIEQELINRFY